MSNNTTAMLRESGLFAYIGEADLAHLFCALKFAELVAANAREQCAKQCDEFAMDFKRQANGGDRSGASDWKQSASEEIAEAIRALGERT